MLAIYIVSGILILLAVILFIPISVDILFYDRFEIIIKYGFLKFKPKIDADNKKARKPESETKIRSFKSVLKDKGFHDTVSYYGKLVLDAFSVIKRFLKGIKFKKLKLYITVASEDAAETAIGYGIVSSVIYTVVGAVDAVSEIREKAVSIKSDFDKEKPSVSGEIGFSSNLFVLFRIAITLVIWYLKLTENKGEKKNERKQH